VDASELNAEQQDFHTGPLEGSETIVIVEDEEVIVRQAEALTRGCGGPVAGPKASLERLK
jgi:hypothetical protein